MIDPAMREIVLMLGMPGAGLEGVARGLHRSGAGVVPAGPAVAAVEQFARRIASGLGLSAEEPGPLALAGRTIAASAALIDADLETEHLDQACALLRAAAHPGQVTLLASPTMFLLPRFWLRALAMAEIRHQVVLVDRNPLALAPGKPAEAARTIRRTIFAWLRLTLQLLAAAPDTLVLPVRSVLDEEPIDPRLRAAAGARWSVPAIQPHPRDAADLATAPVASAQAGELAALLTVWNSLSPDLRHAKAGALALRLDEAMAATGIARPPARRITGAIRPSPATPAPDASIPARPLLLHYHIFKNAGTSVDRMLKANFGDAWLEQEFSGPLRQRQQQLRTILAEHPNLKAFSSHTAMLPDPQVEGRVIVPILFMRHPLLRLRSAYRFERKQDADTRGSILAKSTDLRGYVDALLADPAVRQARNFQAFRFAAGTPGPVTEERARALATIERLPFVGLVEAYRESIERLALLVAPLLPEFEPMILHENATSSESGTTAERIAALRDELGTDLFDRLVAENALDLELFERVASTYGAA